MGAGRTASGRRGRAGARTRARLAWAALAVGGLLAACQPEMRRTTAEVTGDAAAGRTAIIEYGCGACHVIPGVPGASGGVGPPLGGFADRRAIAGVLPNTPDDLARWIQSPQDVDPGNIMPDLGVSEREARDMAAYLYSLR